ncbi:hypothetical protein CC79DRAFT_1391386 [Sarocladium strictum]
MALNILSTASPVGSTIFSAFALVIISLVVLLILRYYLPLRSTPAFYLVPLFFALWLPSIVVLLVPIDLASSARTGDEASRGIWLPDRVILVSWRITYWLTFALTWFLLPILAEYADAGYREPKDKLLYSLRANAQFYAMSLVAGLVFVVYVCIWITSFFDGLKGIIMGLAYFVGLALAIYLMGHGLVSIPRRLMRNASVSGKLRRIQGKAPKVYEKMQDSLINLEEIEAQVSELARRKTGSAVMYQDWIEELQDMASLPESQPRTNTHHLEGASQALPTVITEKYLADLTRKYVRARHSRTRYQDTWNRLVQNAVKTQTILDSVASKSLDFGDADPHAGPWDRAKILSPYQRYICHYIILPYAQLVLGAFLAVSSVCIIWSEVIKSSFENLSIIKLTVIHHWSGNKAEVGFAGQVIAAYWICYMCAAALISMTEVKVWRGRALVKRNTAYESAFWYALQVAKLTVPLSYNFVTLLTDKVTEKTVFYHFFGELIELTPVGDFFNQLYPVLVLFPALASLFGFYGRIKRIFVGMDIIDDEEDNESGYGTGSWREGRDLISREVGGNSLLRRREEASSRFAGSRGNGTGRSGPVLSVPSARGSSSSPARSPIRPVTNNARPGQSHRGPIIDEPEDDNLFQIFGHRVMNTFDTLETPKWMQDIGQGIKKPKWMGGDDDNNTPQRPDAGQERNNSDFRRWFGGDSGIRL